MVLRVGGATGVQRLSRPDREGENLPKRLAAPLAISCFQGCHRGLRRLVERPYGITILGELAVDHGARCRGEIIERGRTCGAGEEE